MRERRIADLRDLQLHYPRKLIGHYCNIAGKSTSKQLPHGVSFSRRIDTIVKHGDTAETSPGTTN